jgi:hypothetical protein
MKAFPVEYKNPESGGMDLRDYFAAKALQGYISYMSPNPNGSGVICEDMVVTTNTEAISKSAYLFADAMIKHREETK